jgi:hypothetical protein
MTVNNQPFKLGGNMKEIVADEHLVAYCGLYCGACKKYLQEKCPGCHNNEKASWCKVRSCCMDNTFKSCAECKDFDDVMDCKAYNNIFAKFFGFVFNSDRQSCIKRISETSTPQFAAEMAEKGIMSFKRKK